MSRVEVPALLARQSALSGGSGLSNLRRVALLMVAAVLFCVGCTSDNKGKIEGTNWSSLPTTVKGTAVPAGALRLEFSSTGGLNYSAGNLVYTGTYSLGMGSTVTFHLAQPLAGNRVHRQTVKIDGERLKLMDSDGTTVEFEKK